MATAPKPNLTKSEKWIEKEFGVDLVKFKDVYQPEGSKKRAYWVGVVSDFQQEYEPFSDKVKKVEKIKFPKAETEGIEAQERLAAVFKSIFMKIQKKLDVSGALSDLDEAQHILDTLNKLLADNDMKAI